MRKAKKWNWITREDLKSRLAAAYRAGWEDGSTGRPFTAGYYIDRSQFAAGQGGRGGRRRIDGVAVMLLVVVPLGCVITLLVVALISAHQDRECRQLGGTPTSAGCLDPHVIRGRP